MNTLAHRTAARSLHFDFTAILPKTSRAYFCKEQRLAGKLNEAEYFLGMARKIMEKPSPRRSNLESNSIIYNLERASFLFHGAKASILFDAEMANKAIKAHTDLASELAEFSRKFPYRAKKAMLRQEIAAIKKAMEIRIFKGDSPSFQALLVALNDAEARLKSLIDSHRQGKPRFPFLRLLD